LLLSRYFKTVDVIVMLNGQALRGNFQQPKLVVRAEAISRADYIHFPGEREKHALSAFVTQHAYKKRSGSRRRWRRLY
jgi:hypothetical protein